MKKHGCFLLNIGHAQYEGQIVEAKVPFHFSSGTHQLSAGEYTLKPWLQYTTSFRNDTAQVLSNIGTNSVESREVPSSVKLVFNRYDRQHFMTQISDTGNAFGRPVTKSLVKLERAKKDSPGLQIALRLAAPLMEGTGHQP